MSGIPMNLHAADRNKMRIFWRTEFSNEATYFPVLDFRAKNIDNNSMKLGASNFSE
jgi:hypothetical protein